MEAGVLRSGTKVLIIPGNTLAVVRSVEVGGKVSTLARAGDNVEVTLSTAGGFDTSGLAPGSILCHPEFPVPWVTRFEARVLVLDGQAGLPPLLRGAAVSVHSHMAREEATVSALVATLNAKSGEVERAKPRAVPRGATALVEVTVSRRLALEEYADLKALGRVALREGGRTVAVGVVTKLLA